MFYVYISRSTKNKDIYVGYSDDLKTRFATHNKGRVKSTKAYRPWRLIYYEAYLDKSDATKRERQLKMHAVKKTLLTQLEGSIGTTDDKIGLV